MFETLLGQATSGGRVRRDDPGSGEGVSRRRVLLAGNPNCGKTSLFNALTGARQKVANYPGVTVERKDGGYRLEGALYHVTDLPGTYSLTSFSPEERIARREILASGDAVVVVVVDSTTLKRSLLLLTQIMQAGARTVLCLNMADEARRAGQRLDLERLSSLLGFPVVETVAPRGEGIPQLKAAIAEAAGSPHERTKLRLGQRLETALERVRLPLQESGLPARSLDWFACRLLLEDPVVTMEVARLGTAGEEALRVSDRERARIQAETGMDVNLFLTERHYGFVDGLLRSVVHHTARADAREFSDRLDGVLANRILGIPIFLGVMYALFWLTFRAGELPMRWVERGFASLGTWVTGLWPAASDSALRSLLVDGIIGGVGGVLVFIPNIVLLFVGLAILEDSGYMARSAFLVDRLMHRFGLHGRSFIPLMTGFGCSIPGIMATRTLENERDRLATMLVLPLMSCGARLPIWMLLIPAFFAPSYRAPMLWSIYMTGILLALVLALVLRRTVLRGEEAPFVMELPPYRLPTVPGIGRKMVERSWLYLRKAGTMILAISIVMWFITSYPKPADPSPGDGTAPVEEVSGTGEKAAAEALGSSYAGRLGHFMEPVIAPLGFDWKLGTALIGSFAAKEVFVAQMGIVYSLGETDENSVGLREAIRGDYTPLAGISLMLFLLIATPCMATVAVTRRESGGWRWALLQFFGLSGVAYLISLLVYQVGSAVS